MQRPVEVASYLRLPGGQYILAEDATATPPDSRYVEGSVEITVGGVPVVDKSMWDYVDQLWSYISDMVAALTRGNEASTYFPDQPLKLSFRRVGQGRIMITLEVPYIPARAARGVVIAERPAETRTAVARETDLVAALRDAGSVFFTRMMSLIPENTTAYADALARLNAG